MASNIDTSTLDANYPVAGVNNSSQGFRTNFLNVKNNLNTAKQEIENLQTKKITIEGDATGVSGILGAGPQAPASLILTLANSGVTAGTYTSEYNNLSFTVDSKGRLIGLTSVPVAPRPGVVGSFKATATQVTPLVGNVRELQAPIFTFDQYGTLTAVDATTNVLKFGILDHPLTKGSMVVGNSANTSVELPVPAFDYNANDIWALAWRPNSSSPTDVPVKWHKLPAPTPVNPARVISLAQGPGINVSTDPNFPEVAFDGSNFPEYPSSSAIQPGSQIFIRDSATNKEYKIDLNRVFEALPDSGIVYMSKLKDDLTPQLGGNLYLSNKKITSDAANGITLETLDTGFVTLRNVTTVDTSGNELDPGSYVVAQQTFPRKAPTQASFLRNDATGNMYWESVTIPQAGVSAVTDGVGVRATTNPETRAVSVEIDFSDAPIGSPDNQNDYVVFQDSLQAVKRARIADISVDLGRVIAVDPVNGSNAAAEGRGSLSMPYASLQAALDNASSSFVDNNYILLFPGDYLGQFKIDKPNVHLVSLMGPDVTTVRGRVDVDPALGMTRFRGINFSTTMFPGLQDHRRDFCLNVPNGIEGLEVVDCYFFADDQELTGRKSNIISLSGIQSDTVMFKNCRFHGVMTNNLTPDPDLSPMNLYVGLFKNNADGVYFLSVTTGPNTRTVIDDAAVLGILVHNGGILQVKNVNEFIGDYSEAVWDAFDPDTDDSPDMGGYPREAIRSIASSASDLLLMQNITLVTIEPNSGVTPPMYPVIINKTGTCKYMMANVARFPEKDTLTGQRLLPAGTHAVDIPETVITGAVTGSYTANTSLSKTWDLTLNGNTTVTLTEDPYGTTGAPNTAHTTSITILVRQGTGGANTVSFVAPTAIVWSESGTQPATSTGAGKISVFTFSRVGTTWLGTRTFNQI